MQKNYNIYREKIDLVYAFIPLKKIKTQSLSKELVKKELRLSDEFIVGGSGLTVWRKGVDLFVQLALLLNELRPSNRIKLLWVGDVTYEFQCQYEYEAERLGIKDQIIFTGVQSVPQNYFQLFDVFALTSREDPFPLVAIEAASLNKPVLCFADSGGMPEHIENGKNGVIIKYGDVRQMANEIIRLMDDADRRKKMGEEAGKLMRNFDVEIAGKQILSVIENVIAG